MGSRRPAVSNESGPHAAVDPAVISDIGKRLETLSDTLLGEGGIAEKVISLQLQQQRDQGKMMECMLTLGAQLNVILDILKTQSDQLLILTQKLNVLVERTEKHTADIVLLKSKKRNGSASM